MSSLARVVSTPCSSISFNYVKSVHVLANRTSQAEVPKTAPEGASRRSNTTLQPELRPWNFIKHPADFQMHPEKLKQIIREKDGQIFCNYLSREGLKKRKRCLMIMEKRKKLMETTGMSMSQYTIRNMSLVHRPNQPSSYTSYINSQLHADSNPSIVKESSSPLSRHRCAVNHISEGESQESLQATRSSRSKETFLNLNAKDKDSASKRKTAEAKPAKKKKVLKPLQVFKKSRHLSKACETNLPPQMVAGAHNEWVELSDSGNESNEVNAITKRKNPKMYKVRSNEKVDRGYSQKDPKSFVYQKNISDGFVDNVFTLFDKVKLDSKKHRSKGSRDSIPFKNGMKTLCCDPKDTYQIINSTLKCKEMQLKRQFGQIYLIRLPKTTPEGYRVLLYSVRDNDPTKMNFSDCIKGFCMYNDCVLSEDGLQEGYVVIFDMKGVQLGHLARVSLPALRCFMLYIQEAHPCRLKGIHILNTATWIHHVMRLVVPLVRSELLNLVQFHKGSLPEGFPLDLLPSDYGGEAPSVEDLDNETKSMVHKYKEWLLETVEWKSDESKRLKKASWWGLFNGSNKTNNVELDEKTILKNLQID